ncbi:DUF3018 family protein [Neorhizobium lilium]|uniref:DUF3018 family protein n=1 Tax=Neorhizobium lilium TaxID=2503024 RepID=A0A444LJC5_9HYPH|nr:antitoxin MazE-like protein [Neorhizobium lilium]RWX79140.1 DUF3018 family protein [Neorhizobium lilium]
MSATAHHKVLRDKLTGLPVREVRLLVPDARHPEVQKRIRASHRSTDAAAEAEAIAFIEAVSDYGADGLLENE